MERKQILNGVSLTVLPAQQFKRCSIVLRLCAPAQREDATAFALLPRMLEVCCADYPDKTQLSCRLCELYGAQMEVSGSLSGQNRCLTVVVGGIRDEFALQGENLSQAYTQLALGVLLRPYMPQGAFSAEELAIEKEQLKKELQNEINDKRGYCCKQARRRFFGDSPSGIEPNGYLDEVDGVTPQAVTEAYRRLLQTAQVEVFLIGLNPQPVQAELEQALGAVQRTPAARRAAGFMPAVSAQEYAEPMDTEQGKLCMMFTAGSAPGAEMLPALRVALTLFGGSATSRLFTNVREKKSLCYYCAARFDYANAVMTVDSGIEHKNAAALKQAVLDELTSVTQGEITPQELEEAKRSYINSLRGVQDSVAATQAWYVAECERGTLQTPQQAADAVQQVTAQQVRDALRMFTLSVTYTLTQKGGAADA